MVEVRRFVYLQVDVHSLIWVSRAMLPTPEDIFSFDRGSFDVRDMQDSDLEVVLVHLCLQVGEGYEKGQKTQAVGL